MLHLQSLFFLTRFRVLLFAKLHQHEILKRFRCPEVYYKTNQEFPNQPFCSHCSIQSQPVSHHIAAMVYTYLLLRNPRVLF